MAGPGDRWLDRDAGPLVRPYAVTRGRTAPSGPAFGLITVVAATGRRPADRIRLSPEHAGLLERCARPAAVADLAADLRLPLGVVRVLLGDLREEGLVRVVTEERRVAGGSQDGPGVDVLREVLHGLRAL